MKSVLCSFAASPVKESVLANLIKLYLYTWQSTGPPTTDFLALANSLSLSSFGVN